MHSERKQRRRVKSIKKDVEIRGTVNTALPYDARVTRELVAKLKLSRLLAKKERGEPIPVHLKKAIAERPEEIELLKQFMSEKKTISSTNNLKMSNLFSPEQVNVLYETNDLFIDVALKNAETMASSKDQEEASIGRGFLTGAGFLFLLMHAGSRNEANEAALHLGILSVLLIRTKTGKRMGDFLTESEGHARGGVNSAIFNTQHKRETLVTVFEQFRGQHKPYFRTGKKLFDLGIVDGKKPGKAPHPATVKRALIKLGVLARGSSEPEFCARVNRNHRGIR